MRRTFLVLIAGIVLGFLLANWLGNPLRSGMTNSGNVTPPANIGSPTR